MRGGGRAGSEFERRTATARPYGYNIFVFMPLTPPRPFPPAADGATADGDAHVDPRPADEKGEGSVEAAGCRRCGGAGWTSSGTSSSGTSSSRSK